MAQALHRRGRGFGDALVAAVLDDAVDHGARIYGISGLQGSGKSTLAAQVAAAATARGLRCAVLSIDDLYLARAERLRLARDVHPLLATRGPPGTHDLACGCRVLDDLRDGRAVAIPRFDKPSDDCLPRARWPRAQGVELVLFEGWFLGTPAEADAALVEPVNALERDEDPDGAWRRWCNAALARDYPALWARIDRLLVLQAPSFDVVAGWRLQGEHDLPAAADPSTDRRMDRAGVHRFVQHFERVGRQALRTLPHIADRVVALDAQRRARLLQGSGRGDAAAGGLRDGC